MQTPQLQSPVVHTNFVVLSHLLGSHVVESCVCILSKRFEGFNFLRIGAVKKFSSLPSTKVI